jgi:hypothetical protein
MLILLGDVAVLYVVFPTTAWRHKTQMSVLLQPFCRIFSENALKNSTYDCRE